MLNRKSYWWAGVESLHGAHRTVHNMAAILNANGYEVDLEASDVHSGCLLIDVPWLEDNALQKGTHIESVAFTVAGAILVTIERP